MKYAYVRVFLNENNQCPSFGHTFVKAESENRAYTLGGRIPDNELGCPYGYGAANDYVFVVEKG